MEVNETTETQVSFWADGKSIVPENNAPHVKMPKFSYCNTQL